ncbi:MAG: ABC transporter permease [Oscillospiraceae bacterium]|nr:ABC transporter permease [Oscillospiraceae bacterium]
MVLLIKYALLYGSVLLLVAMGGMWSEHSGVINIALEGIMTIGAVAGALALCLLPEGTSAGVVILASVFFACTAGIVYSSLLAFASINLKADQTIGGTALNLMGTALALVLVKNFNLTHSGGQSPKLTYDNSPFIFKIGEVTVNVFVLIALVLLIVSYYLMYKTRFGLRLRACGEHPQAAASVGINVYRMRWAGVLISGLLGGLGGFAYVVPSVSIWNFEQGVAGMGFLSLAVMIFGQWHPVRIALCALFFALFKSLADIADSTFLGSLNLAKEIYRMMPFIFSLIVLAFTSKRSKAPKAEGIPYDKGMR